MPGLGSALGKDFTNMLFVGLFQTDAVPAPDVHLNILQNQLRDAESTEEKMKIVQEIEELLKVGTFINVVVFH